MTMTTHDISEQPLQYRYPLKPYAFQLEGIEFMQKFKRVLNRDKPGLGKTIEGAYASVGETLIVAPNYLTEQWYNWLNGITSGVDAHPPYAPYGRQKILWARGNAYDRVRILNEEADFHIINVEMLGTHSEELMAHAALGKWQTIIFDEAHHLRTHNTKRALTAIEMVRYVEYVFNLTATPIWKEVDDLFMQFRLLQPDVFTSYYGFVDKFCIADNTRFGTKVYGAKKEMRKELQQILDIVSIGRNYETAGRELPPLITKNVVIEFPEKLMRAYQEMISMYRIQLEYTNAEGDEDIIFDNFSQILRAMRLLTAFPGKYEAAKDIIEDSYTQDASLHTTQSKTIVFTWYRDTCEEAAKVLGGVVVHGGLPAHERRKLALDSNNPIICATIASLSEGIDLSAARTVIFLEEHYTPGSMEQALARVVRERHEQSNDEPVVCYYVHVKDTIDQVIHNRVQSRNSSIREVLKEALGI
jgi:superfamily II DNA or RNA helicase